MTKNFSSFFYSQEACSLREDCNEKSEELASMIFDNVRNIEFYCPFSKALKDSFDFLRRQEFSFQDPQTRKIGSEVIFAILSISSK